MTAASHVSRVRAIVDAIMSAPGELTPETVSAACSAALHEIDCVNPYMREFKGFPVNGPFETVSLRIPRVLSQNPTRLVAMTLQDDIRLTAADMAGAFTFSWDTASINPHIPPEGTISFREPCDGRELFLQFTYQSRLLRLVTIHENPRMGGSVQ